MTGLELETARFIYHFTKKRGFPPTVRELASEFSVCVTTMAKRLCTMQKKEILRTPCGKRAYRELLFTDGFKKSKEYELIRKIV